MLRAMSRVAERKMPHNLEAEQALLGAVLFDNETLHRLSSKLEARHFFDPVHGRIFSACADMIGAGELADGVTLRDRFAADGGIREIGGAKYLMKLLESAAPLSTHAQSYAELIVDLALRRDLIRIGTEVADAAENPPESKDGEYLVESAEAALFVLTDSGRSDGGFESFGSAIDASIASARAAYKNKGTSGLATGFRDLDRILGGLHNSDLLIIAGRPSMGKTALATNIAMNIAKRRQAEEKRGVVAFFSLEMSGEQLATRILSDVTEIESDRIRRGQINRNEYEMLADEGANLRRLPLRIDATGAISIGQMRTRARRLHRTHGIACIVVDYLQLMTSGRRTDGRVQEVSDITQGLKALAKDLNVPVVALSQLSRKVEERDDKRPQLSDLRESGSIEQDADVVMFVYREAYYLERMEPREGSDEHITWRRQVDDLRNTAEIIIGKQRHGPIGKVKMFFDSRFTRFGDLMTSD